MNSYEYLFQLISLAAEEDRLNGGVGQRDSFTSWLTGQCTCADQETGELNAYCKSEGLCPNTNKDRDVNTLISWLYKFAHYYTKDAIRDTKLASIQELSILNTFLYKKKTELEVLPNLSVTISPKALESLLQKGLLASIGKSAKYTITQEGRELMLEVVLKLSQSSKTFSQRLSSGEKMKALLILAKLKTYQEQQDSTTPSIGKGHWN